MRRLAFITLSLLAASVSFAQKPGFSEDTLLLQVWLDRMNLSPGSIDGVWGGKTEVALRLWQRENNLPPTGKISAEIREQLDTNILFTVYTVVQDDHQGLTTIPTVWPEKALLPKMNHETVQEKVAERFHTSPKGLVRLNPHVADWPNPRVGTQLKVPDVEGVALEHAARLVIYLNRFQLLAYDKEDRLIALFPVSIAKEQAKRPSGEITINTIAPDPNYLYDPVLFGDPPSNGKKIIQPGPNNPVGRVWFGLSLQGYGIHGSPHPETIGHAESKGCFRLSNWNAVKLMHMVQPGVLVKIED